MCKEEILFHYLDSRIQTDGAGDKKTDKATNSGETEESETEKLKTLLEQKAKNERLRIEKQKLEQISVKPQSEDKQIDRNVEKREALESEKARVTAEEEEKHKAYVSKNQQQKRKLQNGNQAGDENQETERKNPKNSPVMG